jgi:hypothetical protein
MKTKCSGDGASYLALLGAGDDGAHDGVAVAAADDDDDDHDDSDTHDTMNSQKHLRLIPSSVVFWKLDQTWCLTSFFSKEIASSRIVE